MKTLGRQGFSSLVGSPQETPFPADSRSVCQKFARKFGPLLKGSARRSGVSHAPVLTRLRSSRISSGRLQTTAAQETLVPTGHRLIMPGG
jgi:hypothetical protein